MQITRPEISAQRPRRSIKVIRNIRISELSVVKRIDPLIGGAQQSTEADALFFDVPTMFGYDSAGSINYVVEVEKKQTERWLRRDLCEMASCLFLL